MLHFVPVRRRETRAPLSRVENQASLCGTLAILKAYPQRFTRWRPCTFISRALHPWQRRAHPKPRLLACAVDGTHRSANSVSLLLRFQLQSDHVTTDCGWNWSSAPDTYQPAVQEAIGNWGKHCAKVEDRQKVGKGGYSRSCGLWFHSGDHFTASGVPVQQGIAAESQDQRTCAGLQHTPSEHSVGTRNLSMRLREKRKSDPSVSACCVRTPFLFFLVEGKGGFGLFKCSEQCCVVQGLQGVTLP